MRRIFHFAFLGMLLCLSSMGQVAAQTRDPSGVVNRIRQMKSTAVQIGYLSDAPRTTLQPGVPMPPEMRPKRAGTGFFVSEQGYVLTAGHVIRGTEDAAKKDGATKVMFQVGILLDVSSNSSVHMRGPLRGSPRQSSMLMICMT